MEPILRPFFFCAAVGSAGELGVTVPVELRKAGVGGACLRESARAYDEEGWGFRVSPRAAARPVGGGGGGGGVVAGGVVGAESGAGGGVGEDPGGGFGLGGGGGAGGGFDDAPVGGGRGPADRRCGRRGRCGGGTREEGGAGQRQGD